MNPVKTVLLATDLKEQAQGALAAAAILAGATKAELVACFVLRKDEGEERAGTVRAELQRILKSIPMARFPTSAEVLHGEPADAIISYCQLRQPEVLVVGSRQIDQDPLTLGTMAERLLRFAPVETILVRSSGWPHGRFAAAVDLSEHAKEAFLRGVEMCRLGKIREITVMLVLDRNDLHCPAAGRSDAERKLGDWLKSLPLHGVTPRPVVIEGGPKELSRFALGEGIDLVFAGSRGLGHGAIDPLGSFVLRSARRLPCSLWVTRGKP